MKAWIIHLLDEKYGSKSEVVSVKKSPRTYDHVITLGKNSDTRRFADFISME